MGNFCDIIVADNVDIAALDIDDDYWDMFPCLSKKRVEVVKLGMLQSIITGTSFEDSLDSQELVREISEDGPWISQFPEPIIMPLLEADNAQLEKYSIAWVKTEELQLDKWDLPETIIYLKQLRDLVRTAEEMRKSLYLVTSL